MAIKTYVGNDDSVAMNVKKIYVGIPEEYIEPDDSGEEKPYTRVEFIESNGNQYIDTGVFVTDWTKVKMDFCFLPTDETTNEAAFGVIDDSYDVAFRFGWERYDKNFEYRYEKRYYSVGTRLSGYFRHTVEMGPGGIKIDGVQEASFYATKSFESDNTLALFATNHDTDITLLATMRCYSCKIYEFGVLVRDFVPCINKDGGVGLYDELNGVFYPNSGSGSFTAGDVVIGGNVRQRSVARLLVAGYIGVDGVARPFWGAGKKELAYYGTAPTGLRNNRYGLSSANAGDQYILFAGSTSESYGTYVDAFDASLTRTIPSTSLPKPVADPLTASVWDYALIMGGDANWETSDMAKFSIAYNTSLTAVTPPALNNPYRDESGTASTDSHAVFAGGEDASGDCLNLIEGYDKSLTKASLNTLSSARRNVGGGVIGDYALFAGGRNDSKVDVTTVDAFNASFTRSSAVPLSAAMPAGLHNGASTKKHVLFGVGRGSSEKYVNAVVNAYDASLTRFVPAPLNVAAYYKMCAGSDDYVVFAGGIDADYNSIATAEAYDTSLTKTIAHDLSYARYDGAGGTIGNYMLFAGGGKASIDVYTVN